MSHNSHVNSSLDICSDLLSIREKNSVATIVWIVSVYQLFCCKKLFSIVWRTVKNFECVFVWGSYQNTWRLLLVGVISQRYATVTQA